MTAAEEHSLLEKHLIEHENYEPESTVEIPDVEEASHTLPPLDVDDHDDMGSLPQDIHFIVDDIREQLDEGMEDVIYSLDHPLVGKHVHILRTFIREVVHACANQQALEHEAEQQLVQQHEGVSLDNKPVEEKVVLPKIEDAPLLVSPPTMMPPYSGMTFPDLPSEDHYEASSFDLGVSQEQEIKNVHVPLMMDDDTGDVVSWADYDEEEGVYRVFEPQLDPATMALVQQAKKDLKDMSVLQQPRSLQKHLRKSARSINSVYDAEDYAVLKYHLVRDLAYLGPVTVLLNDPKITKIMCEGQGVPLMIIREGKKIKTSLMFTSKDELNAFVHQVAKKTMQAVSVDDPVIDAMYKNFRIQGTLGTDIVPSRFIMTRVQH